MYRSSKNKLATRTSLSALMALGALATGAGIAAAATHVTANTATGTTGSITVHPYDRHGRGSVDAPGVADRLGGVVTNVQPTSITILTPTGASSTFTIDPTTKVVNDRAAATVADLTLGERVGIRVSASSAMTASVIEIQLAHIGGRVVSVNGSTITVADRDGFYRTITVGSNTTLTKAGAMATLADVKTGAFIMAEGIVDANHTTLDASNIGIGTPPQGTPGHGPQGMGPLGMGHQGMGLQDPSGMF